MNCSGNSYRKFWQLQKFLCLAKAISNQIHVIVLRNVDKQYQSPAVCSVFVRFLGFVILFFMYWRHLIWNFSNCLSLSVITIDTTTTGKTVADLFAAHFSSVFFTLQKDSVPNSINFADDPNLHIYIFLNHY